MNTALFKISCLTNLHVGSGDVNFNIVDNEVEKDPLTDYPEIHASGVKGALRDAAKGNAAMLRGGKTVDEIFGKPESKNSAGNGGSYKFLSAKFLARPLRVSGCSSMAYILVTTVQAVNDLIEIAASFGCAIGKTDPITVSFDEKKFVSNVAGIKIEGEDVKAYDGPDEAFLKKLLGDNFAICESLDEYPLPVIARNKLNNGISENLWYEEYVPHHSLFWLPVLYPDDVFCIDFPGFIQLGGNASVGCGYVTFTTF